MKRLKKAFCLVASFAIMLNFVVLPAVSVDAAISVDPVTVYLKSFGTSITSIEFTVNGSYQLVENETTLAAGVTYKASVSGSSLKIEGNGQTYTPGASFRLQKLDSSMNGIKMTNKELNRAFNYLGDFQFTLSGGVIKVYNYIDMETYVIGVVAQEMGNGFEPEALKAQAIAARTYAYNKLNGGLTDGPDTQAYIGYNASNDKVIAAVKATKYMMLTYKGDVIQAYYSARNGGYTERTGYVWSTHYDYYQAQVDEYDYHLTTSAYIRTFKFPKTVDATYTLHANLQALLAEQIKLDSTVYGAAPVYSITGISKIVTHTPPNSRYPANSPIHTKATVSLTVSAKRVSDGKFISVPLDVVVSLTDLNKKYGYTNARVYAVTQDDHYVILTGRGTPHGVGLSQHGANQRAKEQQDYKEILAFYYVGTAVTTFDYSSTDPAVRIGVTTTSGVNLRADHSTTAAVLTSLPVGTRVEILGTGFVGSNLTWYQVKLEDGTTGYLCDSYILESAQAIPATDVSLNITSKTLGAGESVALVSTLTPANTTDKISWKSSNTAVATVDTNGKVTAKAAGSATITCQTSNDLTAACTVTVMPAPTSVSLNATSRTLGVGEKYTLKATLSSGSTGTVSWSSSNSKVATVSSSGVVTAVAGGTATITAKTYNGKTAACSVTVKPAPTSVSLNATSRTLGVGEKYTLKATLSSGSAGTVSWSSSNTAVATVSSSGVVTAVAGGTAIITAKTYNGKTATCSVTVKSAPTSVSLNATSRTLGVGEKYTLKATLSSGSAGTVSWSSSNSKVASVSSSGVVTAIAKGTATITVKTYNGKTRTCTVTVKSAPTSVSLNVTSRTLGVGEKYTLKSTLSSGSAGTVSWSSSNSKVATVSSSGVVTAVARGTATITVKTYNGKTRTCTVTVKSAPTSVSLNATSKTLWVKQTYALKATLSSGSAGTVSWSSSNKKVATVSSSGVVTAISRGTATITVKTYNGKTRTCKITVK